MYETIIAIMQSAIYLYITQILFLQYSLSYLDIFSLPIQTLSHTIFTAGFLVVNSGVSSPGSHEECGGGGKRRLGHRFSQINTSKGLKDNVTQKVQGKTESFILSLFFFRFTIKCRGVQLQIYSS